MIDFAGVNEEAREKVENMVVKREMDTDYLSLKIRLKAQYKKENEKERRIEVGDWTTEGIERFRKSLQKNKIEEGCA